MLMEEIVPSKIDKKPWEQYFRGRCTCGAKVKSNENFCKYCGNKLLWGQADLRCKK